jgi:hypothetical protein
MCPASSGGGKSGVRDPVREAAESAKGPCGSPGTQKTMVLTVSTWIETLEATASPQMGTTGRPPKVLQNIKASANNNFL